MTSYIDRRTLTAFVFSFLLLVGAGLLVYRTSLAYREAATRQQHALTVIYSLEKIRDISVDSETATRGYALTGEDPFLEPYENAAKSVDREIEHLRTLTRDESEQVPQVNRLDSLVKQRLAITQRQIGIRRAQGLAAVAQDVARGEGKQVMDEIRKIIAEMEGVEERRLAVEAQLAPSPSSNAATFALLAVVLAMGILGLASMRINRQEKRRHLSEQMLQQSHNTLEQRVQERTAELRSANESLLKEIDERKQAQKSMADALQYAQKIVEASPIGIITYKASGEAVDANLASAQLVGATVEDLRKQNFRHIESWRRSGLLALAEAALASDTPRHVEAHTTSTFGKQFWVNAHFVPFTYANEPYLLTLFEDIDERKKTEAALRESETKFKTLFETANEAILISQGEKFLDCNLRAEALFGCGRESIVGHSPLKFSPPTQPDGRLSSEGILEKVQAAMRGLPQFFEWKHIRHDGTPFDAEVSLSRVVTPEAVYLLGIIRDITERKKSAESLKLFRLLIDQSNDAIQVVDLETMRLLDVNTRACLNLGYTREELLSMSVYDIDPTISESMRAKADADLRKSGSAMIQGLQRRKDGSTFPVEISMKYVQLDRSYVVCAVRDVTERKNLEEQLHEAQKMEAIGQLAGGIAHDFNNVLNVIFGYSDLLLEDIGSDESQRERIEEIKKAGERAASLVRQLLAFSRKQVLEPRVTNLNDILRNVETMLRHTIGEDIALQVRDNPAVEAVKVDPVRMEQIILNLAVNSRDAMPHGGQLTLETANATLDEDYFHAHGSSGTPGEYVMLAVSDTGMGMDEATQKKIFEPFFTTKEVGKGTGLGLATVYGIVKQSGGHIWVYSEPGKGTTFKIYFPRADEVPQAPETAAPNWEETRGTETILVVEDDEASCAMLCEYLLGKGYTVLQAHTGGEAIRIAECHPEPIALVITDVVMPGMGGPELAGKLAASRPQIKVLFVSGYTQNAVVHHGVLDPGIEFLQKPYSLPDVARKIRSLLS